MRFISIFSRWFSLASVKVTHRQSTRGFTLIELVVVVTIMLIFTTGFLLRQQRFNSSTILRGVAYSVALSIRQAQVYGTATRESAVSAFSGGTSAKAYGVYFSNGSNTYILFADLNNNQQYDNGESVQTFTLSNGFTMSEFCVTSGVTQTCSPTLTYLTILFKRPDPDSCFATNLEATACQPTGTPAYTSASIRLQGDAGASTDYRKITIGLTGQISVGLQGS